jgi:DNA-binding response OmpR family regulator
MLAAAHILLLGSDLGHDGAWPRVRRLLDRCAPALTEDPKRATVILGLGSPEQWPYLLDGPLGATFECVWLPDFAELAAYDAARERMANPRFYHGGEGLRRIEALLTDLGLLADDPREVDPARVEFFYQLRGDYLDNLRRELAMLSKATSALGASRGSPWGRFLLGVHSTASAYEMPSLAHAASQAADLIAQERRRPGAVQEAVALLQSALDHERSLHDEERDAGVPPWLELSAPSRVLWITPRRGLAEEAARTFGASGAELMLAPDPVGLAENLDLLQPDLLLLDQDMGAFDGLDVASQLRASPRFEGLPLVVLLQRDAAEARLWALQAQVDRCLPPSASAREVAWTCLQLLQRLAATHKLGGREPLTNLYAREALKERLKAELLRAQRSGQPLAVMLIQPHQDPDDPDKNRRHFWLVVELAQRTFRRTDLLGRYDPQTLVVALLECDARVVITLSKRLAASAPEGVQLYISASLGDGHVSASMLLADADARLRAVMGGQLASSIGHCTRARTSPEARRDGKPRVMLVDTDETILGLLRFFCEREGFEVREAHDGPSALDVLEQAQAQHLIPDAVVLEAHLPGLDGFQVLEAIHARYGARVAVILMSVQQGGERVARAFQLGAVDFIGKPFHVPELIARLKNALARAGAA